MRTVRNSFAALAAGVLARSLSGQTASTTIRDPRDPTEIPIPPIKTSMPDMPGVDQS